jgi:TIR domain
MSQLQLPTEIEHHLAALSQVYAQSGERQKQEIIVNARIRMEEWTYDNWDGGTYGHALYLVLPGHLYLAAVGNKSSLQKEIKTDINKIHNVSHEFVAEVFLEMEKVGDRDWRRESGVLRASQRVIMPAAQGRIWGKSGYRVFLSHKAEVKRKTGQLKDAPTPFGISSFVAHVDIHPTKEWQDEIENALASMDAFVALLTDNFHESDWTDQEVGYALGRGVPLIAVKLGRDPYGFIAKFQALTCDWDEAALELAKLLINQPRMLNAYVAAVPECSSFDEGNAISQILPFIESLSEEQAEKLASAFNENSQLQGSYGFNGKWPAKFGDGLASYLTRGTRRRYVMTSSGEIGLLRKRDT